jgi:hypothetical protein
MILRKEANALKAFGDRENKVQVTPQIFRYVEILFY